MDRRLGGDEAGRVLTQAAGLLFDDEPAIAARLVELAAAQDPSAPGPHDAPVRLRVFGRVEVVDATGSRVVRGRPAQLLALLALRGPTMTTEAVITALWPDLPPGRRGRERLRTVLARTRREAGDLVVRGEDTLHLGRGVAVDAWEFERLADRALGCDIGRAGPSARAALAIFDERVAPGLDDHAWAVRELERHRLRALALLDRLADEAEDAERPAAAVAELLRAVELAPTSEHRVVRAARLMAATGGGGRALDLLERTRRRLADDDLAPTADLRRLEAYLRRQLAGTPSQRVTRM